MFVIRHLEKFKACFRAPPTLALGDTQEGRSPKAWFRNVDSTRFNVAIVDLPAAVNRQKLLAMASDRTVRTLDLCVSIFAWGGMHGANRKRLFEQPLDPWITLADQVRDNKLRRAEAYDAFAGLRTRGKASAIAGMGPAYFTKLLYFLSPGSPMGTKGYIMDQWLGCSVNLLTAKQVVKLDHNLKWEKKKNATRLRIDSIVSAINTGDDYEKFCLAVEALSSEMGASWTPELTERALIADGGRSPHPWRDHVVKQRQISFEEILNSDKSDIHTRPK